MPPTERHVTVQVLPDGDRNGVEKGIVAVPPSERPQPPPQEPTRPQDMSSQELRAGEGDVIDDLFRADERTKVQVGTVTFTRIQVRQYNEDGSPQRGEDGGLAYGPLQLHLRRLRQSELDQERRRCARIWEVDDEGVRANVADPTELAARWVVRALVPEERGRYLEDKRMWNRFGTGGPIDTLDAWLTAGELQQASAMVLKMSGIPLSQQMERFLERRSGEVEDA